MPKDQLLLELVAKFPQGSVKEFAKYAASIEKIKKATERFGKNQLKVLSSINSHNKRLIAQEKTKQLELEKQLVTRKAHIRAKEKALSITKSQVIAEQKLASAAARTARNSVVTSGGGGGNRTRGGGRFNSARRFNGVSDVGFAGLGIGYAFSSLIQPAAELEKILDRIQSNRSEFQSDSTFQNRLLKNIRSRTINTDQGVSTIAPEEFAAGFLKIVKDGISVSRELTETMKNSNSIAAQQIGSTEKFNLRLSEITSNIARAAGEPEAFGEVADVIGELVPKNITDLNQLEKTFESLSVLERVAVGTLSNTRFDVGNLTKAIRNTIGTQQFTSLPIQEILKLMTAVDRVAPTGRSSGTSVRRFFQEIAPKDKKDFDILRIAGINSEEFIKKISTISKASEAISLVEDLQSRLESATGNKTKAASLITQFVGTEADKAFRGMLEIGTDSFREMERRIDEVNIGERIKLAESNLSSTLTKAANSFKFLSGVVFTEGGLGADITSFFQFFVDKFQQLGNFLSSNPAVAKLVTSVLKFIAVLLPLITLMNGIAFVIGGMTGTLATAIGLFSGLFLVINELTMGTPMLILTGVISTISSIVQLLAFSYDSFKRLTESMGLAGQAIEFMIGSFIALRIASLLTGSSFINKLFGGFFPSGGGGGRGGGLGANNNRSRSSRFNAANNNLASSSLTPPIIFAGDNRLFSRERRQLIGYRKVLSGIGNSVPSGTIGAVGGAISAGALFGDSLLGTLFGVLAGGLVEQFIVQFGGIGKVIKNVIRFVRPLIVGLAMLASVISLPVTAIIAAAAGVTAVVAGLVAANRNFENSSSPMSVDQKITERSLRIANIFRDRTDTASLNSFGASSRDSALNNTFEKFLKTGEITGVLKRAFDNDLAGGPFAGKSKISIEESKAILISLNDVLKEMKGQFTGRVRIGTNDEGIAMFADTNPMNDLSGETSQSTINLKVLGILEELESRTRGLDP